jgi:hypothetical protein
MNNFQSFFLNFQVWGIAKFFMLFAIVIYIVFALVVVKQVKLMTNALELGYESILKLMAYLHLAFSILVFIFALIIL